MNVLGLGRTLALVCSAALGSGCDLELGGIGCGLNEGFANLEESLARVFGGGTQTISSDDQTRSAEAYCGRDDCELRNVLLGSTMALQLDFEDQETAADVDALEIEIESSAPDVVTLDGFALQGDSCGNVRALGELRFSVLGEGALVVHEGGRETARFTFHVQEADSLRIAVAHSTSDEADTLSGQIGETVRIETDVRNADGQRLSTGGQAQFWIDDPEIAQLNPLSGGLLATGEGPSQLLAFTAAGTTRVHALVANLSASLAVEVRTGLDEDAGGAGSEESQEEEQP